MSEHFPNDQSIILVISGPTGSGKTTLCERMVAENSNIERVVTSTTRAQRPGERDGFDYYFFAPETFLKKIDGDEFYEFAQVFNRDYYGTLKSEIDAKLSRNSDLLINLDVQGAASMRQAAENTPYLQGRVVTVFVRPGDMNEIKRRLQERGDHETEIERRLKSIHEELEQSRYYDHIIHTTSKSADFQALMDIYKLEKDRRKCS